MANTARVRKTSSLTRLEKTELFVYYRYACPPADISASLLRKVLADELRALKDPPSDSRLADFGKVTHKQVFGIAENAYCELLLNLKRKIFEEDFRPIMSGENPTVLRGRFCGEHLKFSFYETRKDNGKVVQDLLAKKHFMRALVFNVLVKLGTGNAELAGPMLKEYVEVQSARYQISKPIGEKCSMQDAFEASVRDFTNGLLDWWATSARLKNPHFFSNVFLPFGGSFGDGYKHLEKQFLENAANRFLSEANDMLDGLMPRIIDGIKAALRATEPPQSAEREE